MPRGVADHCRACRSEYLRRWPELNPEAVAAHNAERRLAYRAEHPLKARPCVVCGKPFTKRPDAIVCGEECRRARKLEQRRERRRLLIVK